MLAGCRDDVARARGWAERERDAIEQAEQALVALARAHA
jgi:hypothetical protein